jgi:hypothetical protein
MLVRSGFDVYSGLCFLWCQGGHVVFSFLVLVFLGGFVPSLFVFGRMYIALT